MSKSAKVKIGNMMNRTRTVSVGGIPKIAVGGVVLVVFVALASFGFTALL